MGYNLDISTMSVQEYKNILARQNLLPGRRMLVVNIEQNFDAILKQGIATILALKKTLSTPNKVLSFAKVTGISEEYLILLKREMGSLEQKPVNLENFPDIDEQLIAELSDKGIKNSKEYYDIGLPENDEIFSLCDLVRINGVGAVAARTFYEAGYRSVQEVAEANATVMLESISRINEAKHYYKAKLGIKDMQFCIDFAVLLLKQSN